MLSYKEAIRIKSTINKGWHLSVETRHRMSESHKGRRFTEEHRKNLSRALTGLRRTETTRKKISLAKSNPSDKTRMKIGEKSKGRIPWNRGKRGLQIAWNKGKPHPEETCRKISEIRKKFTGELASNWKGGISFEPYCKLFNRPFKERVRAFFKYRCFECGRHQMDEKCALHVHHVHFNKKMCCDGSPRRVVALCRRCHLKTSYNRDYWAEHFMKRLQNECNDKCFFTKEEYAELEKLGLIGLWKQDIIGSEDPSKKE